MDYARNNLRQAASPYLRQHQDNPIWWQEWSRQVLEHARQQGKMLFVSVGYATCHWCHVMANEAFSDEAVAEFLNQHCVSIKVDREQRPDIDRFLMSVAVSSMGAGGWPLNAFLSPQLEPITAMTYVPVRPRGGMPGFLHLLQEVKEYYESEKEKLQQFRVPRQIPPLMEEGELVDRLYSQFDSRAGGFGHSAKFPPHSQLLFLLYYSGIEKHSCLRSMLKKTLDAMLLGGLHDHLQGGFFRYCVDRDWQVPHFEKMLSDQAFLLWIYSLASGLWDSGAYRQCAENVVRCLRETFTAGDLYVSGHDADTDHEEGGTYLWGRDELERALTDVEYARLQQVYQLQPVAALDGKIHLRKREPCFLPQVEEKLLCWRRQRRQPFVDRKAVTSLNCLVGVGLVHASRYLGKAEYLREAERLFQAVLRWHYREGTLVRSSIDGWLQTDAFLEDYAAALLLASYLYEDTRPYRSELEQLYAALLTFRQPGGGWDFGRTTDFPTMSADELDLSLPAASSMAELARARTEVLLEKDGEMLSLRDPLMASFFDIAVLVSENWFHVVTAPETLGWDTLPVNTLQKRGPKLTSCYRHQCKQELPRRRGSLAESPEAMPGG